MGAEMRSTVTLPWPALLALLLSCQLPQPAFEPIVLPIETGREHAVSWESRGGCQAVWLDASTTEGRELTGPVLISAAGTEVSSGHFSIGAARILGQPKHVRRYVSTPSGARGLFWLFDLQGIDPGIELTAHTRLTLGPGVSVARSQLEIAPCGGPRRWLDALLGVRRQQ